MMEYYCVYRINCWIAQTIPNASNDCMVQLQKQGDVFLTVTVSEPISSFLRESVELF